MNIKIAVLATSLLLTGTTFASPLIGTSGFAAPTIAGASTVVTFDSQPNATFASLTSNGVTVSGIGGLLRTDNTYANQYNGRGSHYVDNNMGATSGIRINFAAPVNGFAFNWGASDDGWVLSAFDTAGALIESFATPITMSSNAGDYIGIQAAGIAFATLTDRLAGDWVFIDNIVFSAAAAAAVPEPQTFALMGLGLLGLGLASRRRLRRAPR